MKKLPNQGEINQPFELIQASKPHDLIGWNDLASNLPFYLSEDWLHYADRDKEIESLYWGGIKTGRLSVAISTHWASKGFGEKYSAKAKVYTPSGADNVLTLGGHHFIQHQYGWL